MKGTFCIRQGPNSRKRGPDSGSREHFHVGKKGPKYAQLDGRSPPYMTFGTRRSKEGSFLGGAIRAGKHTVRHTVFSDGGLPGRGGPVRQKSAKNAALLHSFLRCAPYAA